MPFPHACFIVIYSNYAILTFSHIFALCYGPKRGAMALYPLFMLLSVHALAEFRDHINLKLDHSEFSIIMAVAGPLFSWAQDIRICHLQLHQYSNMKSITPGLS